MQALFAAIPLLFAQAAAKGGGGGEPSSLYTWAPLLPLPIIFYFLMIRPQQQMERKRKDMLDALKKNDRVLTTAGIYGTVHSIDNEQDKVVLRVDDDKGVRLAFSRASIVRVVEVSSEKDKSKTAETV